MMNPEIPPAEAPPTELTPTEMTFLIGSDLLALADIADPTILRAANAIKADVYFMYRGERMENTMALGAYVLMGGFLALLNEGAISLRYVETKKLRVLKSHHVMVEKVGDSSYAPPTIEGGLFQGVSRSAPLSVKQVVGKWFGPHVEDPGEVAYGPAWDRLVSLGMIVLEDVPTGKKGKLKAVPRPNMELIAQVVPQLVSWSERWIKFGVEEAELSQHLLSEIKRTLSWKEKTENDDSDW